MKAKDFLPGCGREEKGAGKCQKDRDQQLGKAHPHRFRRTALTNALNRGMPLQEAMILAGHSKPETTMRYCTVDQEAVQYHHKKYLSA